MPNSDQDDPKLQQSYLEDAGTYVRGGLPRIDRSRVEREIAQMAAHATLKTLNIESSANWTYSIERLARNMTAIDHLLYKDSEHIGPLNESDRSAAVLVARGWHDLALLQPQQQRAALMMNSAVYYEMGGYQANAACLARLAYDHSMWSSEPTFEGLVSAFIQRLFVRLIHVSSTITDPPPDDEVLFPDDLTRKASQALTVQALCRVTSFFLSGRQESVDQALGELRLAQQGFREVADATGYNTVAGLRQIVPLMVDRSTWHHLHSVSESLRWHRYLRVLARGLSSDLLESRSISELWPSQRRALDSGLLNTKDSYAVRMPTSAGKTRVAELAIVKTLVSIPNARCIYIAPYRALASEIEDSFVNLFHDLGYGVSAVPGGYDQDEMGEEILSMDQVLIVTPEKLDLLFRLRSDILDQVALVVIDEGHIVSDKERGPKFELLISRLRRRVPSARFLMMSAVVPDETLHEFASWLGQRNGQTVSTNWRPSLLRHGLLDWRRDRGTLRFAPYEATGPEQDFIPNFIRQRRFEYVSPKSGRRNRPQFPRADNKSEITAETTYSVVNLGPVLVFSMQPRWTEAIARSLLGRIELAQLVKDEDIPRAFVRRPETPSALVAEEWLGPKHDLVTLLRQGIAYHHGRLPSSVREAIEADFRANRLSVMIATNTLAQGVNLPVRTVIIHSCTSRERDGSNRVLPARDYWNIAGRAGRAGAETEGLVIHIAKSDGDRRDFERYRSRRVHVESVESALFNLLRDLTASRISSEDAAAQLDADLLALLVEEDDTGVEVENLGVTLSSSLFHMQAEKSRLDVRPIIEIMSDTALAISRRIPSTERRKVYASTGLCSQSCRWISDHVASHTDDILDVLTDTTISLRNEHVELLLEGLAEVKEMEPRNPIAVDTRELLSSWCDATPIHEIAADLGEDPQDLTEFVEDWLSYRLPWGVSGYLRIASFEISSPISSPLAKNVAGMLKFGLPSPEAVWAMSAGVVSRGASVAVADAFLSQRIERSPIQFRRWLSRLNPDSLSDRLKLTGSELESTARAILRAQPNEHLRRLDEGMSLLPFETRCTPMPSAYRSGLVYEVEEHQQLSLERDRDSKLNRNAVFVSLREQRLAPLPVDAARALAPELDTGLQARATVLGVRLGGTSPEVTVRVSQSD